MALLRLLCFPSTNFGTHQLFSSTTSLLSSLHKTLQPNNSLFSPSLYLSTSCSLSSLSYTLPFRTPRSSLFLFHASSSTQAQPTVDTPELEESETVEVQEQEEDEGLRTRLLAQNVPWTCTADDLRPLFEKYGTVLDIELSMHNKTRNRGLAFVTMGSPEEALVALSNLESYEFEGRALKLNWARPRKKQPSSPAEPKPVPIHNLFVANLPYQARAKDLKEFFNSENANVALAEIIFHDNPRRSSGYGFVSFNTKEEAESALSAFQGKVFMGRPIRVARSRKFLRQQSQLNFESENTSPELNSDGAKQLEKTDEIEG